jgi:HAD superfamily hydrolase (TIGR01490 family)
MPDPLPPDTASPGRAAAFFDVDGTLVSTHIVHQYVYLRKSLASRAGAVAKALHPLWLTSFYLRCLHYLYLDRVSRSRMNIAFYRNYRGLPVDEVHDLVDDCLEDLLKPHLFNQGTACVADHLREGRRVVLVTGSIDFIIEPLARHLAQSAGSDASIALVARTLEHTNGRFTGQLDGPPIGEQEKSVQMRRFAENHDIDLSASYAYGDSIADLPMLETVGFPNVVNGDRELRETASQRGWPSQVWTLSENGT